MRIAQPHQYLKEYFIIDTLVSQYLFDSCFFKYLFFVFAFDRICRSIYAYVKVSVYVDVYVYANAYYVYAYVYVYEHPYAHAYVYVYVYVYAQVGVYADVYVYVYTCGTRNACKRVAL